MPFAPVADTPPIVRRADEYSCSVRATADDFGFGVEFDVIRREIDSIDMGETRYEFRTPVQGVFLPSQRKGTGEFRVEHFPTLVGQGDGMKQAIEDWKVQFHVMFQELISKRPFEFEPTELAAWQRLLDHVDLAKYRRTHPVKLRQFGHVEDSRRGHNRIMWESGEAIKVHLEQMPAEFATFKAGQPFEAIAVYDSETMRFLRADFVAKTSRAPRPSDRERLRFWESLGTSAELPDSEWS